MTEEEQSFLRDVLDRPDEDAPRLAYSAWWDRQGNPRGEFVRLQLELAELRAKSPSDPDLVRYATESAEMIQKHGADWAAAVSPPAIHAVFHRGFVEGVILTARQFLDRAPDLFKLAPIRHLDLVRTRDETEELFRSPHLLPIRSLVLDNCGLTDEDLARLAASPYLPDLRWLSLANNPLGFEGANALAASQSLPKLRYVNFFGTFVDPTEEVHADAGVIVGGAMPEAGRRLEVAYGTIRWLHHEARTTRELPPSRFNA